jgi:hypothetical protein
MGPVKLMHPGLLPAGRMFETPKGHKYVGKVVVEDYQLVEDTVPEAVHRRAERNRDVIIKLRSESIVKDGRLVKDRIVSEFFLPDHPFLCC